MNFQDGISRRRLLGSLAIGGAGLALGKLELCVGGERTADGGAPAWVERAMRWAQLTLVEDDPGKFDPQFWLEYFQRTHSNPVCLSAGGCVAYYPTEIRFHHRSAWLKDSDPFGALVAGCRKQGMVVVARTD